MGTPENHPRCACWRRSYFRHGLLAVTGPEAPVITGLSSSARYQAGYCVSDNGLLIYMADGGSSGTTTLAWMDRTGHIEPVSNDQFWGNGRLSPDGRLVAIDIGGTGRGSPSRQSTIWVFDVQRRTRVRLADADVSPGPIWTPDGRRITFASSAKGNSTIWWMPADGSVKPESILTFDGSGYATLPGRRMARRCSSTATWASRAPSGWRHSPAAKQVHHSDCTTSKVTKPEPISRPMGIG